MSEPFSRAQQKQDVAIVGVGLTASGEHWSKGLRELTIEAGFEAAGDAGVRGKDIEMVVVGNMSAGLFMGQEHVAALVADFLGLNPTSAVRVEAACASGSVAFRQGYLAIASGLHDLVAVGGIEKMTDVQNEWATSVLSGAMDFEWEAYIGATFPGIYALIAQRYMFEYGLTREQLAEVAVKNHYHASFNPLAHFRDRITIDQVLESPLIADPLRLLDCSPISDGAACVLLAPLAQARKYTDTPILVKSCAQASDTLTLFDRRDVCTLDATVEASKQAYNAAQLSPKEIDLVEVHDCFTIAELLALEDLGFCKKGEAGALYSDGQLYVGGTLPVNTDGGLKASGHPVGATGVKQIVELVKQLRGEVKRERQVKGAEVGLAHNVGGSGATAVVTILERGD